MELKGDYYATCTGGCCGAEERECGDIGTVRLGWRDQIMSVLKLVAEAHKVMDGIVGGGEFTPRLGGTDQGMRSAAEDLSLLLDDLGTDVEYLVRRLRELAGRF